jgi:lysophospholipase L1-like esterase
MTSSVDATTGADRGQRARALLRRLASPSLVGLLVLSLLLNAFLVRAAFEYFKATIAIRLDPAGLKVYAADRGRPATGGAPVILFGDSRALMWAEPKAPPGHPIVNHGIGFQTTAELLIRLDTDVLQFRPAVVVLEGGVNDLKSIAEFPERRAQIVTDCENNLARIVDRTRQSGATVVLVTVFGIGDVSLWRRPFWSTEVAAAVRDVNAFLPTLVREGVVLFDANAVLDDDHGDIRRPYQLDYLHLSPAGYEALNQKLNPLLSALPR